MIFHENRLPADYLLFLKKRQNLKLSSAANYRNTLRVKKKNQQKTEREFKITQDAKR